MAANKVHISNVPADVLGDLQAVLPSNKKAYIAVGSSVYEVEPAPAIALMEAMGMLTELLSTIRNKKIELLQNEVPELQRQFVQVAIRDIINSSDSGPSLAKILEKLLVGVDSEDLNNMNIGQMITALDKAIQLNMETLPPSFRETFSTASTENEPVDTSEEGTDSKNP